MSVFIYENTLVYKMSKMIQQQKIEQQQNFGSSQVRIPRSKPFFYDITK